MMNMVTSMSCGDIMALDDCEGLTNMLLECELVSGSKGVTDAAHDLLTW
jgi:hypothetical protein